MGKIAKNYIYNLIYQLFVMLVPIITAPYLTRTLGAEGTGIYSYVHSMTSIICTFVMLGIYNYGNRKIAYVRDNKKDLSNVFWQIISARIVIAVLGTIVYFSIILFVNRYIKFFIIYYTYMLAYFVDCTWLYVGVEDMKWAVIKNTVTKILAVAGIFLFVHNRQNLSLYIFIQGTSILLSNLLAYSQLSRYVQKPRIDFSSLRKDLCGALLLFLPSVATTIYTQCDKVMIELLTGKTSEVAYYDYSEKIVTIPLTFITVLNAVMMPRVANEYKRGNVSAISSLLNQEARFSLFLAFPMVFGLIAVADKLVPWYLGDEFGPTVYVIMITAPIIISNSLSGISGSQYFTATNQIGILIKSQFLAVVANIIINAILIPLYGLYGAAVATLVTSFACSGIQYYFLLRQIELPGLFKQATKYLAISIMMQFFIKILSHSMKATPITSLFQILVGVLFYFCICIILKDEQVKMFKSKILDILNVNK